MKKSPEGFRVFQRRGRTAETEFVPAIRTLESVEKLAAEDLLENTDWKEKAIPGSYPMTVVGGKAADRYEAVEMWMEHEVLSPGVQYGEEPDLRTQVSWIRCDFQQCFCHGTKQQVVQQSGIVLTQPVQLMGQGEDYMEVRQAEQLSFPASEPSLASLRLALRAVPIPTGVKGDGRMTAPGTLIQVAAQSRLAATLDGAQHFQLLIAEPGLVLGNKAITVRAN